MIIILMWTLFKKFQKYFSQNYSHSCRIIKLIHINLWRKISLDFDVFSYLGYHTYK
jgi:hypothetical protein